MKKKGSIHYRAKLLTTTLDLSLSMHTKEKISEIIGNYEEKEKENVAKQILEKIKDCKTEAEVIAKLKLNTR